MASQYIPTWRPKSRMEDKVFPSGYVRLFPFLFEICFCYLLIFYLSFVSVPVINFQYGVWMDPHIFKFIYYFRVYPILLFICTHLLFIHLKSGKGNFRYFRFFRMIKITPSSDILFIQMSRELFRWQHMLSVLSSKTKVRGANVFHSHRQ